MGPTRGDGRPDGPICEVPREVICEVSGLEFRVSGFGFLVSGSGFRD